MTIRKAIDKALAAFEKTKKGDIRGVSLWEFSGKGNKFDYVLVRVEYAVDGDYSESDKNPLTVAVRECGGKITAEVRA